MKKIVLLAAMAALSCGNQVSASSQDECAIWLCAPAGFPSPECNAAHSEFKHRIKHGKSPFPSLSSCTEDGTDNSGLRVVTGYVAVISAHKEKRCIREEEREARTSYGRPYMKLQCVEYETYTVPVKYIEGTGCIHGHYGPESNTPKYCSGTLSMVKVLDQTGNVIGSPFYY